ncbi:MAG: ABC transporter ATP-binding protein [Spirochaetaceae bacterium]|jgi:branched-chain amino acid transport system ATP-binding protein|nr:ABC transporter ATP-binding protein [Spirochaetaceae bacterium]
MLRTENVTMQFGGLTAVSGFSITVNEREIVGLIGPNGAGKTTVFNMITGMYAPTKGRIIFNGHELQGRRPDKITACGIARTFQNIRLFHGLSVLDNVLVACNLRERPGLFESVFHLPAYQKREKAAREKAFELLEAVGLAGYAGDDAVSLPYGKQRRLEIVRALATEPRLLLLDEPAAGMNPQESAELMNFITEIRSRFNIAVLLIEHHMQVVMGICERLYVLDYGITIAEGAPDDIRKNKKVIDAYLGVEDTSAGGTRA